MADVEQPTAEAEVPEKATEEKTSPEADKAAETEPDTTTAADGSDASKEAKAEGNGTNSVSNATEHDSDYFWNAPCKRYRILKEVPVGRKSTAPVLVYEKDEAPTDATEVAAFVKEHKLTHGDVLAFSEERDSKSFIVCREPDKDEFKILANTDDSSAGYLTIPRSVMEHCTNGVDKYQAIIRDSVAINLHVSPKDTFLKKKFGEGEIPHVWDFDIHFSYGELEEIYVRTPGADWEAFDAEETTLEDIKDFFESGRHYMTEFTVTVELEGDKLEEYKTKYGEENDKHAWMQSLPEIPPTWKLEKGESSGADDEYCWEWMLSGPEEDEEEVRESVAHFLRGFEHKFH